MSMRDPRSASPEPIGVFGTLSLLAKNKQVAQAFPIDSRTLTIGRDESCDIRIYSTTVSRLHTEINFDALTDKATICVHGTNGIKLNDTHIKPPSKYPLADGDFITVDKKMFRFEYLSFSYTSIPCLLDSPIPSRIDNSNLANNRRDEDEIDAVASLPTFSATPNRSKRLSISSRRQSQRMHVMSRNQASPILEDLIDRASSQSPLASKTRDASMEMSGDESMEQDQHDENNEDLVWIEQKDEKELEEEVEGEKEAGVTSPLKKLASPARRNIPTSFVTPQPPKRVLKASRTSLAPRTRKDIVGLRMGMVDKEVTVQEPVEEQHEFTPSALTHTPAAKSMRKNVPSTPVSNQAPATVYKTPRSIPLPESMDTPYANDHVDIPEQDDVSMEDPNLSVEELTHEEAQAYLSPRSIPLPPSSETPYHGAPQTPAPASRQAQSTPASALPLRFAQPLSTPQVMPQTPRNGQNSLRKNLLLKSARKVLELQIMRQSYASPAPRAQIEVAQSPQRSSVPSARVETPVRDSIQGYNTPSRIALPSPGGTEYSEEYSGEVSEEEGQANGLLQFVYETGQDESDYSTDSEEEDEDESMTEEVQTVEHPAAHQGVNSSSISPSMRKKLIELMAQTPESDDDVDISVDHVNDEDAKIEDEEQGEDEEEEEHDESHEEQTQAEEEQQEELLNEEDEDMQPQTSDNEVAVPETPGRPLAPATRFYTPQVVTTKPKLARGRQSLSERFGAPVRFERVALTPSRVVGSMGPPVRPSPQPHYQALAREDDTIAWDASSAAPVAKENNEAEMSRRLERRKSLATPRVLPAPPSEGFEKLATPSATLVEPSPLKLMGDLSTTPVMPRVFTVVSSDEDTEDVASPLVGLKRKIKAIRRHSRQSLSAQPSIATFQRRATVGFALPSTPVANASHDHARLMRTATPGSRFGKRTILPSQTPVGSPGQGTGIPVELPEPTVALPDIDPVETEHLVHQMDEQDNQEEVELEAHDFLVEEGEDEDDVAERVEGLSEMEEDAEGEYDMEGQSADGQGEGESSIYSILGATSTHQQRAQAMATPSFRGLKEMHRLPKTMPTPSFAGIRDMLKEVKPAPATPKFGGLRDLLQEPKAVPATPAMNGIRNMFAMPAQMLTPAMDGLDKMFEQASPTALKIEPVIVEAPSAAPLSKTAIRSRNRAVEPVSNKSTSTARSTSTVARTRKRDDVGPLEAAAADDSVAPARRSRTVRAVEVAQVPQPVAASRTTRTKKASTLPSTSDGGPDNEVESEMAASTSTAPARRVVRGKVAVPAAPSAPLKRIGRAAALKKVEIDEEDPLDAIEPSEKLPATKSRATKSNTSATKCSAAKALPANKTTRATPAARTKSQPLRESNQQEHDSSDAPGAREAALPKPRARAPRTAKEVPAEIEEPVPTKVTRTASKIVTKAAPATKVTAARKAKPAMEDAPTKVASAAMKSRAKAVAAAPEPELPKRVTRARK